MKKEFYLKKIIATLLTAMVMMASIVMLASPASAGGSNDPTPYSVTAAGVTLPAGQTFAANGHVNIKYKVNGGAEQSKGIHFDPNNNQPGGAWIGKSSIPWTGFGLTDGTCVTWVQVAGYNEHFGEGGQAPVCLGTTPPTTPPDADNKKVTLCHATSSASNPYNKITVSVRAFQNEGHISHNGDIYEAFTYVTNKGDTVNVTAKGNTSLLAHPGCVEPAVDTPVVKPDWKYEDKCGTADDTLTVTPGTGYSVGNIVKNGLVWSVDVTTNDGFVFADGTKSVTYSHTFTDVDCDLPATGGKSVAGAVGILALAGLIILGGVYYFIGPRKN